MAEDSLDKALRTLLPAFESSRIKEAINKEQDITLKHGMVRGKLVSLFWSVWGELKMKTWDISNS